MNITVITVVAGRHEHLAAQLRGVARSSVRVHDHVVISMGDDEIGSVVDAAPSDATVVLLENPAPRLPLARARNLGASTAVRRGADLLVFLDVDCIPGVDMIARYAQTADRTEHDAALLCGPVTYLPPRAARWTREALEDATNPHPARPDPESGTVIVGSDYNLFWSLSFASTPRTWAAIGGFHEEYDGYGGEDTDFAATAQASGIGLRWVGGAHAYHQHHPVSSPPVEHLDDIVRNSILFHRRWNRWPMSGWLDEFERRGLIVRRPSGFIARTTDDE